MLSLVIPTYNEKDNIGKLIKEIRKEFDKHSIEGEIIVVDDNSPDGTGKYVEELGVHVVHREKKLGLSSAVLAGWNEAKGDILGVMDADLSHSPKKIHELLEAMDDADIVIGSRYCKGGKIRGWGFFRKMISKLATLVARLFTDVKDPMSGFFMVRKESIDFSRLNPKGFKILLEVLVKNKGRVEEVPIVFQNRVRGKSKISHHEMVWFLENIFNYLLLRKDVWMQFFKFSLIGFMGTLINIIVLYLLTESGVWYIFSALVAFIIAMSHNFILNKLFTFKEKLRRSLAQRFIKFAVVSCSALAVNLVILYALTESGLFYLFSQVIAIGIALLINFLGNKIWTFTR
ncbi:MAG: glycosyltransferase family 2 protein [Candidatus Woesearchaeota archaeon]